MNVPMRTRTTLLACAALAACATPAPRAPARATAAESTAAEAPPPAPWTDAFMQEAGLVAAEVRIEGPPALREHLAIGQDPEHHTYSVKTVPDGLRQETRVRPEFAGDYPVRCQIDNLSVLAERAVIVLERPADVPVRISASGDAFWHDVQTGEERRGENLELRGDAPR